MLVSFAEEKTGECVVCCHRCGALLMESASTTSYMVCPECGARLVVCVKKGKVSVFDDTRSEEDNVTLVVFNEVKERILNMLNDARAKMLEGKKVQNAAASLEDIEKLIKLSDKKIINYSELIKRDINSAKVYWN